MSALPPFGPPPARRTPVAPSGPPHASGDAPRGYGFRPEGMGARPANPAPVPQGAPAGPPRGPSAPAAFAPQPSAPQPVAWPPAPQPAAWPPAPTQPRRRSRMPIYATVAVAAVVVVGVATAALLPGHPGSHPAAAAPPATVTASPSAPATPSAAAAADITPVRSASLGGTIDLPGTDWRHSYTTASSLAQYQVDGITVETSLQDRDAIFCVAPGPVGSGSQAQPFAQRLFARGVQHHSDGETLTPSGVRHLRVGGNDAWVVDATISGTGTPPIAVHYYAVDAAGRFVLVLDGGDQSSQLASIETALRRVH